MFISKAELRAQVRERLSRLSEQAREESDAMLFARLAQQESVRNAGCILAFYGVETEPRTHAFLLQCLHEGKRVCLPRVESKTQMQAYEVTNLETLSKSAYGIPEPTSGKPVSKLELDVILVPNLCCDRRGYRLGQGGGYYDRYLADYEGKTLALCRALVLEERLAVQPWDIAVETVITEHEVFHQGA